MACCTVKGVQIERNRGKAGIAPTNGWTGWLKNNKFTDRRQVFFCALLHRAHVVPGAVSAPRACAHSSACILASGQFQQTYL